MQQIDIDFEVFKQLTARRRSESHTYNEVIRELLEIDKGETIWTGSEDRLAEEEQAEEDFYQSRGTAKGFSSRGLFLPNGTLLRATHKGANHSSQIIDGKWVSSDGMKYDSPSAAASAITKNNVNGWRFWQAKRPSDAEWRNLDMLPKA
jgi:predicted CopG family antitoxin